MPKKGQHEELRVACGNHGLAGRGSIEASNDSGPRTGTTRDLEKWRTKDNSLPPDRPGRAMRDGHVEITRDYQRLPKVTEIEILAPAAADSGASAADLN